MAWRETVTSFAPYLSLVRAEGLISVSRRVRDRVASAWREGAPRPNRVDRLPPALALPGDGGAAYPLLNVVSAPLHRRSGLPLLVATRLEAEARARPLAVLVPHASGWCLHLRRGEARARVRLEPVASSMPGHVARCVDVVRRTAALVGADAVHVDGVAGLDLPELAQLAADARPLLLTLYDFGAYCPRPHLIEAGTGRFCDYCADEVRCARCLAASHLPPVTPHRQAAGVLLARAAAVISLSPFQRTQYLALFPEVDPARHYIVAPAGPLRRPRSTTDGARPDATRVAFVGAFKAHKGARVFLELADDAAGRPGHGRRWFVFGGSDGEPWLAQARTRPGVRVFGFYPPGELPGLLRRHGIGVALLLSTCPETYSATLSECLAAGVAVIAFDHGAIAERLRGAVRAQDRLVPLERGASGVRAALDEIAGLAIAEWSSSPSPPDAASCAASYFALYRRLNLRAAPPAVPAR